MFLKSLMLTVMITFVVSCGKEVAGPTPPVTPPVTQNGEKVTLKLYGAFWCATCSKEIPEVMEMIRQKLGDKAELVRLELWVPTGTTAAQRPTEEIAEAYRSKLNIAANVHLDPWRWQTFRSNFPGARFSLPAAVLVDEKGREIEAFPPGSTTFVPSDIAAAVASSVNK